MPQRQVRVRENIVALLWFDPDARLAVHFPSICARGLVEMDAIRFFRIKVFSLAVNPA